MKKNASNSSLLQSTNKMKKKMKEKTLFRASTASLIKVSYTLFSLLSLTNMMAEIN